MKKLNIQNESGRSMVEMLGVLAVIGMLSVAGIAGYTIAMNQHRANEAINTAMRAAVMLSAQRLTNPNATLNTSDLGDGITVSSDTDKLVLTLSNVDEKVRSRIKAMGLKNATIGSDENGALTFTFNNDLSERGSGTSGGNTSGGSGQQEPVVDLCAGVDCSSGTCSGGVCDCTGTGYTGDHCETLIKMFKCDDSMFGSVSDNNGNFYGYCDKLGGCKVVNTFMEADKWSEVCNQQLQDGYYICTLGQVFDSEGNMVKQCAEGCKPSPKSSPEDACISGSAPAPV